MLNIVIPMAGAGSRFALAGYDRPKPLIEVHGVPMIQLVIQNLTPSQAHKFIFICQEAHLEKYGLADHLAAWAPGCEIITVSGITDGAAITVLAARDIIDSDEPLMIANSDQYIDFDINTYLNRMNAENISGQIMTMTATDPKWSFIKFDDHHYVVEVREKVAISNEATVGIYNFAKGSEFVRAAQRMVSEKLTSAGEYYVAPAYNFLIAERKKVIFTNIGSEGNGMYGLGIPADLRLFINSELGTKVASQLQ